MPLSERVVLQPRSRTVRFKFPIAVLIRTEENRCEKKRTTSRDSGSRRRLTIIMLQFGRRSTPFSWINVRNRLRETPVVPDKVLNIILSFAVRIVRGFPNNPYTASPSAVAVSVDVLDPDHDCSSQRDIRALFD